MPRVLAPLALLAAFSNVVSAGIQISKPAAGSTAKAGGALDISWKDGGSGPSSKDFVSFTVDLCAGSNDAPICGSAAGFPAVSAAQTFASTTSSSITVPATAGEDKPANAYFVRMVAVAKTGGGTYTTYSSRFSYSGMTGKFADPVKKSLDNVKDKTSTSGPAAQDSTAEKPDAAAAVSGDFGIGYNMQTGPTRYAPMQPVPGTKITAKTVSAQHSTSSVAIAKSHLPIPSIVTTVTQSQTHKVSSVANTQPAEPRATDDMAKFLARWKD